MARVEIVRGAIKLVKIDKELRGMVASPRHFDKRTGDRFHRTIRIAIFPDQAGFDGILSGDVHDSDRTRKHSSSFIYGEHFMLAKAFAARHTTKIGVDHVDRIDIGIGGEKGLSLAARGDGCR